VPAAIDRTFAAHPSAVSVKWRYSNQCRDFTPIELSQFRHLRQEQCRCTASHSTDRSQLLCFSQELLRSVDLLLNEQIELFDLLFDLDDESPVQFAHAKIAHARSAILLHHQQVC
jgi:hypothetical protein